MSNTPAILWERSSLIIFFTSAFEVFFLRDLAVFFLVAIMCKYNSYMDLGKSP